MKVSLLYRGYICTMLTRVKYWRHPSSMWEGKRLPWLQQKSITVFLGVNMQDVSTLQDRLAVMLPLDTDLRSVLCGVFFCFGGTFGGGGQTEADLRSVPDLQLTRHITPREDNAEQTTGGEGEAEEGRGRRTGRTTHSQAGKRTEGRTDGRSTAG